MKIAIAGYGVEGEASARYFAKQGEITIVDQRDELDRPTPDGVEVILGENVFSDLSDYDMVVRTAGLSPLKLASASKIWSATNEFFDKCPAPIIGVTGTKGKGTTSSLIASILQSSGKTVHLVGNIGQPALDVLPEVKSSDLVVYELSSFQLWDLEFSPHIAVVLMIEPDHLDVHQGFEDYVGAKANIATNQSTTDRIVYLADNQYATEIAQQSVGQRLPYPSERTTHVVGDYFYYQKTEVCNIDQLQLVGHHNLDNACAAITAIWPWVQDGQVIAEGLRSFDGLPHRLKLVREVGGVKYYDDSIATTPGSAIAALRSFVGPKVIILGGSDKGADYQEVINECKVTGAKVVAIGQTGKAIAELCQQMDVEHVRVDGSMNEIVNKAHELAVSGGVVILSPASASFDMFKSYIDRGEQFIEAVMALPDQAQG